MYNNQRKYNIDYNLIMYSNNVSYYTILVQYEVRGSGSRGSLYQVIT